jgi:hypothetical protein
MRLFLLLATVLLPIITHAQPRAESYESTQQSDFELAFGTTLLGAGYMTSVLWSYTDEGDQDALYVPVVGPWLELFTLPDCENDDVFCAHSNTTRGVLIASGAAQLVGAGFIIHGLATRNKEERRVIVAPSVSTTGASLLLRGSF